MVFIRCKIVNVKNTWLMCDCLIKIYFRSKVSPSCILTDNWVRVEKIVKKLSPTPLGTMVLFGLIIGLCVAIQ